MKQLFISLLGLCILVSCVQPQRTEQPKAELTNPDVWDKEATTNIRLRPKYGHAQKSKEQKKLDEDFIKETLRQEEFKGNRRAASDFMIKKGFDYLYNGDLKTAMYRFNQAYLLDSLNTDIYWGFGGVYMTLEKYDLAKDQYMEGLSINPENTHLLTDLGSYFSIQYQLLQGVNEEKAQANLNAAIMCMTKSYTIDAGDPNTTFKLSACYLLKNDCDNAWKYYDECVALGGAPITNEYTEYLKMACKRKE
ncbi:MAG: hypothetical protein LBV72_08435 [Tannerella sp.]|jgi:tetratricopeptide (TPR) repeat protein|nr:hypothetical protein [Tannerella sp.]